VCDKYHGPWCITASANTTPPHGQRKGSALSQHGAPQLPPTRLRLCTANVLPQEVTDEQGRRRFHGAFTGGFSAGYYNTVGSKASSVGCTSQ
jgi:G patch domain-containing protein 1